MTLEKATIDVLGSAEKVNVSKDNTVIVNGCGDKKSIEDRAEQLKAQIKNVKSEYDREKLQERLAKILGGVAVLYIGASTEVEMKEKKDRVDDALHATRAAVEEGIVPGGGVALLRCSEKLLNLKCENEDQQLGVKIIYKSLFAPIKTILSNGGEENGDVIINSILNSSDLDYGYNARIRKFENFFKTGVIDPAKVTRLALENAASISGLLITSDCVVADIKEEKPAMGRQANMDGGMGMM